MKCSITDLSKFKYNKITIEIMKISYSLVLFIFLAVFVKDIYSLQCYKCDPAVSQFCGDPFNTSLSQVISCDGENVVCTKLVARAISNMSAVAIGRDCSALGSQSCNKLRDGLKSLGNKLAFCKTCSTDLCNQASTSHPISYIFLVTFTIVLMYRP